MFLQRHLGLTYWLTEPAMKLQRVGVGQNWAEVGSLGEESSLQGSWGNTESCLQILNPHYWAVETDTQ